MKEKTEKKTISERHERLKNILKYGEDERVSMLVDFYKSINSLHTFDLILFTKITSYISEEFMENIDREREMLCNLLGGTDEDINKSVDNILHVAKRMAIRFKDLDANDLLAEKDEEGEDNEQNR